MTDDEYGIIATIAVTTANLTGGGFINNAGRMQQLWPEWIDLSINDKTTIAFSISGCINVDDMEWFNAIEFMDMPDRRTKMRVANNTINGVVADIFKKLEK